MYECKISLEALTHITWKPPPFFSLCRFRNQPSLAISISSKYFSMFSRLPHRSIRRNILNGSKLRSLDYDLNAFYRLYVRLNFWALGSTRTSSSMSDVHLQSWRDISQLGSIKCRADIMKWIWLGSEQPDLLCNLWSSSLKALIPYSSRLRHALRNLISAATC